MRRILTTELLDLESNSYSEVADGLIQLRRINRQLGGVRLLRKRLSRLLREDGPACPLRFLDVATGSADLPLSVVNWSRRYGLEIEIAALDHSPMVARFAAAEIRGVPQVRLVRADALRLPVRRRSFHYALCSLFLHQLDERSSAELLTRLLESVTRAVVVNELRREWPHYAAAWMVSRFLTKGHITRNDAPASVRNAYTPGELRELARRAGASQIRIFRHWPFRVCMVLRP